MPNEKITTLIGVVSKVKDIGEREYSNKIYDHIHQIYHQLTEREQVVLLRGLINICFIVEGKVLVDSSELTTVRNEIAGSKEAILDTENSNKIALAKEIIKLKIILIKSILAALLCIIIGLFLTIILANNPDVDITGIFNSLFRFVEFAFT